MLKLDLEKAFDSIEWRFIGLVLQAINIPDSLLNLIMSYVSSSSLSLLINGTPSPFFKPSSGIRQGNIQYSD